MNIYNEPDYVNLHGNFIHKTALIGDNVKLGKGNIIMPFAVLGHSGFIRNMEEVNGKIEIGDNNRFGLHSVVMVGESGLTKIGNNNLLMNYVNIGHDCTIGNDNEIGAKTIICGFSEIGNNNQIKVYVAVRNRIKIGNNNLIGMGAIVVSDVADNEKLKGNPAK